MREMREERVLLKRVRRGVRRVLYVDPRAWLGRGASSVNKFHSS